MGNYCGELGNLNKDVMKYTNLLILVVLIVIIESCENYENSDITREVTCIQNGYYDYLDSYRMNSMCTSDLCMEYLKIWEELFIERNNISKSFLTITLN